MELTSPIIAALNHAIGHACIEEQRGEGGGIAPPCLESLSKLALWRTFIGAAVFERTGVRIQYELNAKLGRLLIGFGVRLE
jgi:hypothetical protein